jgi:hypothetical protein
LKHYISDETALFQLLNILSIKLADVRINEWNRVHAKAVCTSIKLGSGLGLGSPPCSLLPHPHNQRTTHKCLPFSPATPPTFHTWLRHGIMGVMVQYGQVTTTIHSKNNASFHNIFSETIVQANHCFCTIQKHQFTFTIFPKTIIPVILLVWTMNSE